MNGLANRRWVVDTLARVAYEHGKHGDWEYCKRHDQWLAVGYLDTAAHQADMLLGKLPVAYPLGCTNHAFHPMAMIILAETSAARDAAAA